MLWYLIKFFCVFWQPYGHSLGFFSENAVNFPPSPAHTDILTCTLWVWWSAFLSMFLDFYVDFCAFGDFLLLPPLEMCLWYLMECLRLSLHSSGLAGPLCGGGAWMPLMLGGRAAVGTGNGRRGWWHSGVPHTALLCVLMSQLTDSREHRA